VRTLVFLVLAAVTMPGPASASPSGSADLESLVDRLGNPARQEVVTDLVSDEASLQSAAGLPLVAALRQSGGPHAAAGLARLVRQAEVAVQRRALRALGELGLRTAAVQRDVRRASRAYDAGVRVEALRALGRVGDGSDVPALLEALWAEDGPTRGAALAALGELSGLALPAARQRLDLWWRALRAQDLPLVKSSVEEIELAVAEERDYAAARDALERTAWLDPETIHQTVAAWLERGNARLVREGLRLVARLRLADFAERVAGLARPRPAGAQPTPEALEALRALGLAPRE